MHERQGYLVIHIIPSHVYNQEGGALRVLILS